MNDNTPKEHGSTLYAAVQQFGGRIPEPEMVKAVRAGIALGAFTITNASGIPVGVAGKIELADLTNNPHGTYDDAEWIECVRAFGLDFYPEQFTKAELETILASFAVYVQSQGFAQILPVATCFRVVGAHSVTQRTDSTGTAAVALNPNGVARMGEADLHALPIDGWHPLDKKHVSTDGIFLINMGTATFTPAADINVGVRYSRIAVQEDNAPGNFPALRHAFTPTGKGTCGGAKKVAQEARYSLSVLGG